MRARPCLLAQGTMKCLKWRSVDSTRTDNIVGAPQSGPPRPLAAAIAPPPLRDSGSRVLLSSAWLAAAICRLRSKLRMTPDKPIFAKLSWSFKVSAPKHKAAKRPCRPSLAQLAFACSLEHRLLYTRQPQTLPGLFVAQVALRVTACLRLVGLPLACNKCTATPDEAASGSDYRQHHSLNISQARRFQSHSSMKRLLAAICRLTRFGPNHVTLCCSACKPSSSPPALGHELCSTCT